MLLALCNAIGQSTDIDEALDKVAILKSVDAVPEDNLDNLKNRVKDNSVLSESEKFLASFNGMLAKFGVSKLVLVETKAEEEWDDDIPF